MTESEGAPPKLFEHCCSVFGLMRKRAVAVPITDGGEARHALVFEGYTTKLFQELRLPTPYYTSVLARLKQMGCIQQLSRGGGGSASRWELIDDPNIESFMTEDKKLREQPSRIGQLEGRVIGIGDRLDAVERALGLAAADDESSEGETSDAATA